MTLRRLSDFSMISSCSPLSTRPDITEVMLRTPYPPNRRPRNSFSKFSAKSVFKDTLFYKLKSGKPHFRLKLGVKSRFLILIKKFWDRFYHLAGKYVLEASCFNASQVYTLERFRKSDTTAHVH